MNLPGTGWKVIDPCWGAGHLGCGTNTYQKVFDPGRFTQSNEDFGVDHFPENSRWFCRADGRALTWEEYIRLDMGKPATYDGWESKHAIRKLSLEPKLKRIPVSGSGNDPMVRFIFTKICPHTTKSPPYLFFLEIHGQGGAKDEQRPFENSDGFHYWIDVPRAELGRPGQEVKLLFMDQLDGKDAAGLTPDGWRRWQAEPRGKSWGWGALGAWDLV